MKKAGIAIIGTGEVAQNFHLPILNRLPNVKLVALMDSNHLKAEMIASKYQIKHICQDIDSLLEIDEVDAIIISTITESHKDIALKCISKNKHLLIEKPIARNYEEAKIIHQATKKSKSKIMVGITQRFRYDAKMIKNLVSVGDLGKVFYIQAGWLQKKDDKEWMQSIDRAGGGVLVDLGISLIDSLLWIYDFAPVRSVHASTFNHLTKKVEDVCIGSIKFEDGSIATLEMSWTLFTSKQLFYFNVHGSEGSIKINPLRIYKGKGDESRPVPAKDSLSRAAIYKKSFESEIKHFINSVLDLGPIISTVDEAVYTMKVIDAIYRSAEQGTEILLSEK